MDAEGVREHLSATLLAAFQALARGLGHDVRTPLNSMRINAELVRRTGLKLDDAEAGARLAEFAKAIDADVRRMRDHIDAIFDLLAPLPPRPGVAGGECDVGAVLRAALDLASPEMRRRRIAFEVEAPPAAVLVRASRPEAVRAAVVLLADAVARTPEGGRVTLRAGAEGIEARSGEWAGAVEIGG